MRFCPNCKEERENKLFWKDLPDCNICRRKVRKKTRVNPIRLTRYIPIITKYDFHHLQNYLDKAGEHLNYFHYYNDKPFEIVYNHLVTYVGTDAKLNPLIYGHLDYDPDENKTWMKLALTEHGKRSDGRGKMIKRLMDDAVRRGISELFISLKDKDKMDYWLRRMIRERHFRFYETGDGYEIRRRVIKLDDYCKKHGVRVEV